MASESKVLQNMKGKLFGGVVNFGVLMFLGLYCGVLRADPRVGVETMGKIFLSGFAGVRTGVFTVLVILLALFNICCGTHSNELCHSSLLII